MAISLGATKYSLKYVAEGGESSVTRTISGLNLRTNAGTGGSDSTGLNIGTAIGLLATLLTDFSSATISDYRWLSEAEVTF